MKEICILSGKGGTGKTSVSAAFATLGNNLIVADCDVDAANLYLVLEPTNERENIFVAGHKAVIDYNTCINCGLCINYCRFDAIGCRNGITVITETSCDGCKLCSRVCPSGAIKMMPSDESRWYSGHFRNGRMIHARLAPGEENSGKLVNVVRANAKKTSEETGYTTIIIDGPPGTGCPVISSLTGTSIAVIVTEPSRSGFHDMKRILELTKNFKVRTVVVVNKYDINLKITGQIKEWCHDNNYDVIGSIPFDQEITNAMINCRSITEWSPGSASGKEIKKIWNLINNQ